VEQAENSIDPGRFLSAKVSKKNQKYAVIFGNEVHGVAQEAMNRCDCCIEIPQFGTKHSLNVSVAAGIVIWEIFKKLK
jgi:tRNA G18 (ribose-2'-O)-methylase SpoU